MIDSMEEPSTSVSSSESSTQKRTKRRTIHIEPEKLRPYPKKKRIGPEPTGEPFNQPSDDKTTNKESLPQCRPIHKHDSAMYMAKLLDSENPLPGWTGFNILLEKETKDGVPTKTKIGYLPVIDAPPHTAQYSKCHF
jgi:hypothetical protein